MKTKKSSSHNITLEQARRVLEVVDAGLCSGLGQPTPGQMCVEAAVCYALGQPHGDEPECVAPAVRAFKIALNDAAWSDNAARAAGMRRIAIAQLGTAGRIDETQFAQELALQTVRQILPIALRATASPHPDAAHKAALEGAASACEAVLDLSAADSAAYSAYLTARLAYSAAYSADSAARSAAYSAAYSAYSAARSAYSAYSADSALYSALYLAVDSAVDSAYSAADSAYSAADSAARNKVLSLMAEIGVQALRVAGAAGVKLMDKLCQ